MQGLFLRIQPLLFLFSFSTIFQPLNWPIFKGIWIAIQSATFLIMCEELIVPGFHFKFDK